MPFWYFLTIPELPREISHQSNLVEIKRYLVNENDPVAPGTAIASVENWWATMTLKANGKGLVQKIFFDPGTNVRIGDPIAIIGADGEDVPHEKPCSIVEIAEVKRRKP